MASYNFIDQIDEGFYYEDYHDGSFCEFLKMIRKDKGLSKEDLAQKLNVTAVYVTRLESGSSYPSERILRKLSYVLGIEYVNLLTAAGYSSCNNRFHYYDSKGNEINIKKILDKIYYRCPDLLPELYERFFGK